MKKDCQNGIGKSQMRAELGSKVTAGTKLSLSSITPCDKYYPALLLKRLGPDAPPQLVAMGNLELITLTKTAIFCSARCPGNAILNAFDTARKLREEKKTVISGFHSPVEKECLRILLKGQQPVIICPVRSLLRMRISREWQQSIATGRILLLSPFKDSIKRVSSESSFQRNKFVAALAYEAFIIHSEPGGQISHIGNMLEKWQVLIKY